MESSVETLRKALHTSWHHNREARKFIRRSPIACRGLSCDGIPDYPSSKHGKDSFNEIVTQTDANARRTLTSVIGFQAVDNFHVTVSLVVMLGYSVHKGNNRQCICYPVCWRLGCPLSYL